MDIYSKLELIKKGNIVEILTEEELKNLLETNPHPKHYIGFEISGFVHIGTGLLTALKIKDFLEAGIKPTIFLADYHAWINSKLGGDLELIQKIAKTYFKEAFISLGLEESKVKFVLSSELYKELNNDYWKDVLLISKDTTLPRMLRCISIMGRTQKDSLSSAAILYPAMQAADIWALDVDIAHSGLDQRKVHVLSRELAQKYKRKKVVAIHGKLIAGLQEPKTNLADEDEFLILNKMSKSNPSSCIFIHDSEQEIENKIKKAYCPPKVIENNPIIDYAQVFVLRDRELKIERDQKYGGDISYSNIEELKKDFAAGNLHPMDLKKAVAKELINMLKPSRIYFEKHKELLSLLKEA
jgi:tyrosyl-tRNA synthetase